MQMKNLMIGTVILTLSFSVRAEKADMMATGVLPAAASKTGVTYAADIHPIFNHSCVKCHGNDKPKAKLVLTNLAGVLKGSKNGPVVKIGKSPDSLIVKAVAHLTEDEEIFMPPPHNRAGIKPLTLEQIGLIRAWIDQGAK